MKEDDIKIYLVGFPKSGTSWLIRLMAHTLGIPVKNNHKGNEVTVEINDRLNLKSKSSFIAKVHLLPEFFLTEQDSKPEKIIYLYRDIKAVLVSSFFYFKVPKRYSFLFQLKKRAKLPIYKNILRLCFYPIARYLISKHIKTFLKNGTGDKKIGTWKQHFEDWESVREQHPPFEDTQIVYVSYEEILDHTEEGVKKILSKLSLPNISEKQLLNAISKESFQTMKARQHVNSDPTEVSLLRTGVKDDWKNYLTKKNLETIKKEDLFYKNLVSLDLSS